MCIELRIKSKHLACEPSIIRHEERKLQKQIKWLRNNGRNIDAEKLERKLRSLIAHRKWDVSNEARATFLARAFIAGKPYASVERGVHNKAILKQRIVPRILAMVRKYHVSTVSEEIIWNWINKSS